MYIANIKLHLGSLICKKIQTNAFVSDYEVHNDLDTYNYGLTKTNWTFAKETDNFNYC